MSGKNFSGLSGKIGGNAVKGMIKDIEEKMAEGMDVSAAPASEGEAKMLEQVKQENKKSGENAH